MFFSDSQVYICKRPQWQLIIFGISWGYLGDTLGISWGYLGDILRKSLGYLWDLGGDLTSDMPRHADELARLEDER